MAIPTYGQQRRLSLAAQRLIAEEPEEVEQHQPATHHDDGYEGGGDQPIRRPPALLREQHAEGAAQQEVRGGHEEALKARVQRDGDLYAGARRDRGEAAAGHAVPRAVEAELDGWALGRGEGAIGEGAELHPKAPFGDGTPQG